MPPQLRSLLYRPVHFLSCSGHARRKTRRGEMHPPYRRLPVCYLRFTRQAGNMPEFQTRTFCMREKPRGSPGDILLAGNRLTLPYLMAFLAGEGNL